MKCNIFLRLTYNLYELASQAAMAAAAAVQTEILEAAKKEKLQLERRVSIKKLLKWLGVFNFPGQILCHQSSIKDNKAVGMDVDVKDFRIRKQKAMFDFGWLKI